MTPERLAEIKYGPWGPNLGEAIAEIDRMWQRERELVADGLIEYLTRQWEWSKRTFGPGKRTAGIVQHIRKELVEIEAKPTDLSEWCDVIILVMDGFWRHGGLAEGLMPALLAKQAKNFARTWPTPTSEDVAAEHDRSTDDECTREHWVRISEANRAHHVDCPCWILGVFRQVPCPHHDGKDEYPIGTFQRMKDWIAGSLIADLDEAIRTRNLAQAASVKDLELRRNWEAEANQEHADAILWRNECMRLRENLSTLATFIEASHQNSDELIPDELAAAMEAVFPPESLEASRG